MSFTGSGDEPERSVDRGVSRRELVKGWLGRRFLPLMTRLRWWDDASRLTASMRRGFDIFCAESVIFVAVSECLEVA